MNGGGGICDGEAFSGGMCYFWRGFCKGCSTFPLECDRLAALEYAEVIRGCLDTDIDGIVLGK